MLPSYSPPSPVCCQATALLALYVANLQRSCPCMLPTHSDPTRVSCQPTALLALYVASLIFQSFQSWFFSALKRCGIPVEQSIFPTIWSVPCLVGVVGGDCSTHRHAKNLDWSANVTCHGIPFMKKGSNHKLIWEMDQQKRMENTKQTWEVSAVKTSDQQTARAI